jgi:hypothetical protein
VGHPPAGGFFLPAQKWEELMSNAIVFHSTDEIETIVNRFEACDFAKGEFTHALHLAVAACYLSRYSAADALSRMRSGLIRLTNKFGVKAYHETMTGFWMRMVQNFLFREGSGCSFPAFLNRLLEECPSKDVVYEYYSRDLLQSDQARSNWVEPDLKPISTTNSGTM